MHSGIPPRRHRHGAPSGPWPFIDMDDEVTSDDSRIPEPSLSAGHCRHSKRSFWKEICWCRYPESLYPNWTPRQQKKSKITTIIERLGESSLHYLDIMQDGTFVDAGTREVSIRSQDNHWTAIQRERPSGVRTTAIFVENMTGAVLQMLGTRYNIEPFFFSSSIGWIPSRYQSNLVPKRGDHITITLVFIRPIQNPTTVPRTASTVKTTDTHSPLLLSSSNLLLYTELLALHIVRSPNLSTIISYHPTTEYRSTPAASMHTRVHSTGRSVYWSNIFKEEKDPTFVVLSLLWYAIYAWDESLEKLYAHICFLESTLLAKNTVYLTQELHFIRANLMHYELLLRDFQRTILFVQDTPFPSLENPAIYTEEERLRNEEIMKREIGNLLSQLQRLESSREAYEWKLRNVMDLGFSMVNVQDSGRMQRLTKAMVTDSGALKQISYLTMAFFPPSFAAAFFGMNVTVLNPQGGIVTLGHYFALVMPLTILTVWIVIALEIDIKEVRVRRTSRTSRSNRTGVDPKSSQYAIETGSEDESVEVMYSFNHKNRVAREGEVESVYELDNWTRLRWPFILISTALNERQRRRRRVDTCNTKTK